MTHPKRSAGKTGVFRVVYLKVFDKINNISIVNKGI